MLGRLNYNTEIIIEQWDSNGEFISKDKMKTQLDMKRTACTGHLANEYYPIIKYKLPHIPQSVSAPLTCPVLMFLKITQ